MGVIAVPLLRPSRRTVVIREMGADGEWVRDHQVQDGLSQEEIGVRARAILGRKPTALESGKGASNVRNGSENQPSSSGTEKKSEDPSVPVRTEGEVRAVEEKPSEEEELVENIYPKFKVKVVSGRYLAEVHLNGEAVSGRSAHTHTGTTQEGTHRGAPWCYFPLELSVLQVCSGFLLQIGNALCKHFVSLMFHCGCI